MDARQLKLDCDTEARGTYRVFCRNTGTIFESADSCEGAWANAADKLAEVLSEIRRTACLDYPPGGE